MARAKRYEFDLVEPASRIVPYGLRNAA